MSPIARPILAVSLASLLLLSGCLAGTAGSASPTDQPITSASPSPTPYAASSGCVDGVSFWGLAGPTTEQLWDPDRIRIGYTLPPNTSVLFVAYENDTVLGTTHAVNTDTEYAIASDGDVIRLEHELHGNHTIRVVAVADSNRNGVFDPEVDRACRRDGTLVQAGPRTIDFSAVANRTGS